MEDIPTFHIGPRHQFIVGSDPILEEIEKSHGQFGTLDELCSGLTEVVDIKSSALAEEERKKKEKERKSILKACTSAKAIATVWMPTMLTVAGTIAGAVIGAKISSKKKEPQAIRAEYRAEISCVQDKKQEPSMKALLKTSSNPVEKKEKTPLKKSVTKKAIPQQPQRDL